MDALIVYFSQFGNTRRVAESIAAALEPTCSARLIDASLPPQICRLSIWSSWAVRPTE